MQKSICCGSINLQYLCIITLQPAWFSFTGYQRSGASSSVSRCTSVDYERHGTSSTFCSSSHSVRSNLLGLRSAQSTNYANTRLHDRFGKRAFHFFSFASPDALMANSLPPQLRDTGDSTHLKAHLKTHFLIKLSRDTCSISWCKAEGYRLISSNLWAPRSLSSLLFS